MVISGIALALVLLLRFGPDSSFRRALRFCMVETPARWLSRIERHDLIFVVLVTAIILAGGELFLVFAPEFVMWYAANLAFYLDAVAISALLAAATIMRSAARHIRLHLSKWFKLAVPTFRPRSREVKTRRAASESRAENDDCDEGSLLLLVA